MLGAFEVAVTMNCPPVKLRLFQLKPVIFDRMAEQLATNADFLIGLSAYETGWLGPLSQQQHNLFGISDTAGHPRSFVTYQDCASLWVNIFGRFVGGTGTSDRFITGLRAARYNSVNPDYYMILAQLIARVPGDRNSCGVP